jgi:hypothetical protein
MDNAPRLRRLLHDAAALIGQPDVLLQVRTGLLEVVYVESDTDGLTVHDHGTTCDYLSIVTDDGYLPWSAETAARTCGRFGVQLCVQRFPDSQLVRVQRRIEPHEDVATAVQAVAAAIDEIYARHRRPRDAVAEAEHE